MLGKDHRSHTDYCSESREENSRLVSAECLLSVLILLKQSIHYEDAEIISDTENEGRQYDVHNIELDAEQCHEAENDHPADAHRQECKKSELEAAVGYKQSQKYDYRGN